MWKIVKPREAKSICEKTLKFHCLFVSRLFVKTLGSKRVVPRSFPCHEPVPKPVGRSCPPFHESSPAPAILAAPVAKLLPPIACSRERFAQQNWPAPKHALVKDSTMCKLLRPETPELADEKSKMNCCLWRENYFKLLRRKNEKVRGKGKYSDQNSCDDRAETFGERTVLESELFSSLCLCCCHRVCWSIEKLEGFKHALS